MSSLIDRMIADDFVWVAITDHITGKRKQSGTRFINFNCPMCTDRRMRCGVKQDNKGIVVSCFNCGFKTIWKPGDLLSRSLREFLSQLGVSEIEIKRLNHKALTYRSMFEKSPEAMAMLPDFTPSFEPASLPSDARSFEHWANSGCTAEDFIDTVAYVYGRGEEIASATTYYWSPTEGRKVIIPFSHEGRNVGWSSRVIDANASPRYRTNSPPNFLYNMRSLVATNRVYGILVEGLFDALAIDGVATLGARLNQQQAAWIKSFGKTIILVPDRDARGDDMIAVAKNHGWRVAFPSLKSGSGRDNWWDPDIKDVADAVRRYGRLYTLLSIIETSTKNPVEISLYRKMFQ
jgi:predicted RNA-binding Zn-ribbon protein involved in translation (DUF1610 family)